MIIEKLKIKKATFIIVNFTLTQLFCNEFCTYLKLKLIIILELIIKKFE